MKALSSSIIVLAGAVLIAGGANVSRPQYAPVADEAVFAMAAGCIVGLIGIVGWMISLRRQD